jgi:hypothetical protein
VEEPAAFFQNLGATDAARQRDIRISEMTHLGDERFLVLEGTDQVSALFEIDLAGATNILGDPWDNPATLPSLEQTADLAAAGIVPVATAAEARLLASSLTGQFPPKIEAVTFVRGSNRLVLINDDDFGIADGSTEAHVVEE